MGTAASRLVRPLPPALAALSLFLAACQSQPPAAAPPASTPAPANATTAPAGGAAGTPVVAAPTQGGTVTIGVDQEPPTMDPEASPSAITFYITSSTGETLLYLDQNRKI